MCPLTTPNTLEQLLGPQRRIYRSADVERILNNPSRYVDHLHRILTSVLKNPEIHAASESLERYYALGILDNLDHPLRDKLEALLRLPGDQLFHLFGALSMDYLAHLFLRHTGYTLSPVVELLSAAQMSDYSRAILLKALSFLLWMVPGEDPAARVVFREIPYLQGFHTEGLLFKFWAEYGILLLGDEIYFMAKQLLEQSPSPYTNIKRLKSLKKRPHGDTRLHEIGDACRRGSGPTLHDRLEALHYLTAAARKMKEAPFA